MARTALTVQEVNAKKGTYLDFCAANRERVKAKLGGQDVKPTAIVSELARRWNLQKKEREDEEKKKLDAAPPSDNKKKRKAVELEIPLECPECLEQTLPPMCQCPLGHVLCSRCHFGYNSKLHKCPGCPLDDEGLSLGDLVVKCREKGLPATGSKSQLLRRLGYG